MTELTPRLAKALIEDLAMVFGDGLTAKLAGPKFSCSEADAIARALLAGGQWESARVWLEGHALRDQGIDQHGHFIATPGACSRYLSELQRYIDTDLGREAVTA
jgi:hypothetical protein